MFSSTSRRTGITTAASSTSIRICHLVVVTENSLFLQRLQDEIRIIQRADLTDLLAQSEVCQLQMTFRIQQHVVRLDVTVDVPKCMDATDRMCRLSHEELRHVLRERILLDQKTHQVPTRTIFHDHVQVRLVDKRIMQGRQPPVVRCCLGQRFAFRPDMSDLVLHDHHLLLHTLQGVDLDVGGTTVCFTAGWRCSSCSSPRSGRRCTDLRWLAPDQPDLSECTPSDNS
mmetsp:Transcript_27344/g.65583  ORF Transcript_27344/g.65583 Transcript_27344/m.65583 type:complete len:228 (-) Transcript_27344:425-1108(-)